jgi:hypothetical protein
MPSWKMLDSEVQPHEEMAEAIRHQRQDEEENLVRCPFLLPEWQIILMDQSFRMG